MAVSYEQDFPAWADEQARLIRARQFQDLDLEHLAEEIEDVGRAERNALQSSMGVLLGHLIKWDMQPAMRTRSWERTVRDQRREVKLLIEDAPSLRRWLEQASWIERAWLSATRLAAKETGIGADRMPEQCPWSLDEVMIEGWYPPGIDGATDRSL